MLNKVFASFLFGLLTVPTCLGGQNNYKEASAAAWEEKVSIRNLMAEYAKVLSSDSTANYATAESGKYSFFIRHGYLGEQRVSKYDNVTYVSNVNSSYSTNVSDESAIVQGWQIKLSAANYKPADGVICGITANEKSYFSADYVKLGGWPSNASFNWYIQKSGETACNLIKTVTFVSAAASADCSGLDKIVLDQGDTIYWEFYYSSGGRNIQENNGKLPIFNISEYYELPSDTIGVDTVVAALADNATATTPNGVVEYTVKNSSITSENYSSATAGNLGTSGSDYYLASNELTLNNGQKVTFELTAKEAAYVQLQLTNNITENENLTLSGYLYKSSLGKTKQIYSVCCSENFDETIPQGGVLMAKDDVLYVEYSSSNNSEVSTNMLPMFVIAQDTGKVSESNFPKYNSRDYSALSEISHDVILKESARMGCKPIATKDFDISLLTGKVSSEGDYSIPFTYITYVDGEYIDADNDEEIAAMYEGENAFNAVRGAAAETTRISFSDVNYVIYKFTSNKNTHVKVSHDVINAGWINGSSLYAWGYQKINGKIIETKSINLPVVTLKDEPLDANYLAMDFDLKQGDTAYFVIGTAGAHNANLTVAPVFTSNPSQYDENARNSIGFDYTSFTKQYHDLVSQGVSSQGEELQYGLISILFGHGNPNDIQRMDSFTGTGNNDANDSLSTGIEASNPPKFQRWQMRCGKNDDAIIKFTAGADLHLSIVWRKEGEITSWATHTALKSYAVDTDGFVMLSEVKQCVSEGHGQIDDTYYNYDVHLKNGQSFIVDYTSMGANYGVIQYDFVVTAVAAEFDASKVFDFVEAKSLYNHYTEKVEELRAIVDALNIDDYSIVNWAYIDEAYTKFVDEAAEAKTVEAIDELFNEAKARIESIKTIEEESDALNEAKAQAKQEVREYLDSKKNQMSSANQTKAEELYRSFVVTVDKITSVSKISIEVTRAKAQIDQLCDGGDKTKGCGGNVVTTSVVLSILALAGMSLLVFRKREHE